MLTRLALFRLERSITAHMKKVRTIVVTSLITTSSLLYAEDPKPEAAPAPEKKETVAIALDKSDGIGLLKAGDFAHPIVCKKTGNRTHIR